MTRKLLVVETTAPTETAAESLAHVIVGERLAACVHVMPIKSTYQWNGTVETATEWRLAIKTAPDRLEALWKALSDAHPYDTPQWLVIEAEASPAYAAWAEAETR